MNFAAAVEKMEGEKKAEVSDKYWVGVRSKLPNVYAQE